MSDKHTPGPWTYVPDEDVAGHREPDRVKAGNITIIQCPGLVHNRTKTTANARLIAAAPDLLAALREMTALFEMTDEAQEPGTDSYAVLHLARAAISKAISTTAEG